VIYRVTQKNNALYVVVLNLMDLVPCNLSWWCSNLKKKADTTVALEDTLSKSLTPVTETFISFTQNHTECLNYKTLDDYIINCI
jgi:hypothetical protein